MSVSRFIEAQQESYNQAYKEIERGKKTGHWIWYIFPQLKGLGRSSTSEYYGISDLNEAKEYLRNSVLGPRIIDMCMLLLESNESDPVKIFGYTDSMKVKSSMTLFEAADPEQVLFGMVLDKFYKGERDWRTLEMLEK